MAKFWILPLENTLMVEMDGQREALIVAGVHTEQGKARCREYLSAIADKLTADYDGTPESVESTILNAMDAVRSAETAERFLEVPTFPTL